MSVLALLITAAAVASLAVFVVAFRFAVTEIGPRGHAYEPSLPRAAIVVGSDTAQRWARGALKQRAIAGVRTLQAACVAFGVTAIFIMLLCMAGVVAVMLIGG